MKERLLGIIIVIIASRLIFLTVDVLNKADCDDFVEKPLENTESAVKLSIFKLPSKTDIGVAQSEDVAMGAHCATSFIENMTRLFE